MLVYSFAKLIPYFKPVSLYTLSTLQSRAKSKKKSGHPNLWCSLLLQSSSNNEAHSLFLVCSSAVLCVFLAALLDDLLSLDVHEQKNAEETCLLHFFSFLIHTITVLFKSIPYNKPRHTQYIRFFNQKKMYLYYLWVQVSIRGSDHFIESCHMVLKWKVMNDSHYLFLIPSSIE